VIVFCLVNTYDRLKLHEIHLRSIARAIPLCYAFDFHLALYEFRFWKSAEDLVRDVVEYTTIGEPEYAYSMLERNRIHLIDSFPAHFGELIATTPEPDEKKSLSFEEMVRVIRERSTTFLIGLGRRGLPKDLMEKAKYHFEATGKGVSLETCTAMGVIATVIHFARVMRWKR